VDTSETFRKDSPSPDWTGVEVASPLAHRQKHKKPAAVQKGAEEILNFGPSPYVKNGLFETPTAKDYIGACKERPEPDDPEEHMRPPKPVQVEHSFKSFDLLKSNVPFDPSKHTVAVVDDFKTSDYSPNGPQKPGLSHGEISAAGAEQAGFNVLRLQMTHADQMASVLAEISKETKSGNLPLRPDDAINVSYGHHWSFKETSCLLDMPVTGAIYGAQRPEIIKRIQEVARGTRPARAPADGKWLTIIAAIGQEVDALQKERINLVVSAGNKGPNYVNLDFINASVQLAAGNTKGQAYPYSAVNALTKTYPSSFELTYDASKKAYLLGRSGVSFPQEEFGGPPHPQQCVRADNNGESTPFGIHTKTARENCPVAVTEGTSFANVEFWRDYKRQLDGTQTRTTNGRVN
jgi:hypothetical protein